MRLRSVDLPLEGVFVSKDLIPICVTGNAGSFCLSFHLIFPLTFLKTRPAKLQVCMNSFKSDVFASRANKKKSFHFNDRNVEML